MKYIVDPPKTMVMSIIGFIISAVYTASGRFENVFQSVGLGENFGLSLGFGFCLVFLMMFVASFATIKPRKNEF